MSSAVKILVCVGLIACGATMHSVSAQTPRYSLDEAIALVKKKHVGTVVRAETIQQGDRTIHRVRLLTPDDRVRTIEVDAQTGIE
jgi:uncharacterized membrane protein YkoI